MNEHDLRARAALEQAGRYFMGTADVQLAANKIAAKLEELGIDYAICGGLAVTAHGYGRTTVDVDIVLTEDGLQQFKAAAIGLGWLDRFPGSRGVRDTEWRIQIDFLLSGGHPGDGQDRGIRFPDPATAAVEIDGKRYVSLPKLIEMKLASGLFSSRRLKDLADVLELISVNRLPENFAEQLHPEVQAKYRELWGGAQLPQREL